MYILKPQLFKQFLYTSKKLSTKLFLCTKPKYAPFEETLNYWIMQHFRNDERFEVHKPDINPWENNSKKVYITLGSKKLINQLNTADLLSCLMSKENDIKNSINVVKNVDEECSKRLLDESIQFPASLKLIDALVYFTNNRVVHLESFNICFDQFKGAVNSIEISVYHLIQIVFYISLLKNDPAAREFINNLLRRLQRNPVILEKLGPLELAIFCNSVYRSGTKVRSKNILRILVETLKKDTVSLLSEERLFISIIKPLFQAKYNDYLWLEKLFDVLKSRKNTFYSMDFILKVYIYKLFCNALYSDEEKLLFIADAVFSDIKKPVSSNKFRIKDIEQVIKSSCEIGFDSVREQVSRSVIPFVQITVNSGLPTLKELKKSAEIVVFLAIMDLCTVDLITKVTNSGALALLSKDKGLKSQARINLLLTILSIEHKSQINEEHLALKKEVEVPNLETNLSSRTGLLATFQAVQCLINGKIINISNAALECQVPDLFIHGITIYGPSNAKICIEVLDEKLCLHNSDIPHGYMKLKLRLLRKLGYKVILITGKTIHEGTESIFSAVEHGIQSALMSQ